ncbi:hypothetical protein BOTNAR_0138g00050 [Botryotinia narcissicola]|uniref:Uncharacterized protein n=1 Tax=Botryotinia narcissicola TaxID=278944 RepID=A0A4Z1IHE1_9HELO|nr:hypothetical protein BOTNAR_0138g00050 [Botryotinia narcissicola]
MTTAQQFKAPHVYRSNELETRTRRLDNTSGKSLPMNYIKCMPDGDDMRPLEKMKERAYDLEL